MANKYINKFKNKTTGEEYEIFAASANTCVSTQNSEHATLADSANAIGKVEKYSGFYGGKQREGLKIVNSAYNGENPNYSLIEMNSKGNLSIESLAKHVNIEAKSGVQIKPTTNIIFDSSRRILANKGNEVQVEAKFDDYSNYQKGEAPEYDGKDGVEEEYAELKLHSRNVDLRCHKHGGIALQIAGCDHYNTPSAEHHENKIKFESDRKVPLSDNFNPTPSSYQGEGGKGLEFGTFNNEHTSLYTHDYRFRGQGTVFGVLREAPVMIDGKFDYPTQEDDFKDVITNATPNATWNEIIDAANKCKGKEAIASENYVSAQIAAAQLSGSSVDLSAYATIEYVDNAIASSGGGSALQPGNGITISDGYISVNNYSNIEPLTALTDNADALEYVKIGKSKGNFAVDVTGKYTWEATNPKETTTVDEYDNVVVKGDRVVKYTNEAFYTDINKFYYKASIDTKLPDNTPVSEGTIVYNTACTLNIDGVTGYTIIALGNGEQSFYEDENKYVYKGTKNISIEYGQTTPIKKKKILDPATLSEDELAYYDSQVAVYDEDGNLVSGWEKVPVWTKNTLWTKNEINVNLETDSKIKFAGKKIETVWTVNDVDRKMEEILLSTENLAADATEVTFEKKISKNGDRSGQDTELVYIYGNNVSDPEKTPDEATFIANYMSKHPGATQAEAEAKYAEFMAEGTSFEIRVKVSELLGLVARVGQLESTIADLTSRIEALEGGE